MGSVQATAAAGRMGIMGSSNRIYIVNPGSGKDEQFDFDAYVHDKMTRAGYILPRPIEYLFTIAIIFSLGLVPFMMFQALAPQIMISMISSAWVFALIPYGIAMVAIGLKIASLFGCTTWGRIAGAFSGDDGVE